jgi:hypothetical protein
MWRQQVGEGSGDFKPGTVTNYPVVLPEIR